MTTGQAVANVREGLGATLNFLLLFSFFLTLVFFFILPFSSVVTAIAGKGGWHLVQIGATLIAAFSPSFTPPPSCHRGVPELSSLQPMQVIQAYFLPKVALPSSKVALWAFVAEHLRHYLLAPGSKKPHKYPAHLLYLLVIIVQVLA